MYAKSHGATKETMMTYERSKLEALRALLDDAIDAANCDNAVRGLDGYETAAAHAAHRRERAREAVAIIAADALPALLALAEAVRELAGPIAMLADPDAAITVGGKFSATVLDDEERDAARRVLAILDPNPTNEGA